jgi:hypothetical protein
MVTQEQNQVLVNYVEKNQNAVSKYLKTTFKFESKECFKKIVNSKRACRKSVVVCPGACLIEKIFSTLINEV